jgi:hypothetical protein
MLPYSIEGFSLEKSQVKRSRFRPDEDEVLRALVGRFGTNSWSEVADAIPGRTIRQCRDRWKHYLACDARGPWTPEEDDLLLEKIQIYGLKWSRIAELLTNRTDLDVKTRWHEILRGQKRSISPPRSVKRERVPPPQDATNPSSPKKVWLPSLSVDPALLMHFWEDGPANSCQKH